MLIKPHGARPSQRLLFKYFAIVDGWNMNAKFFLKQIPEPQLWFCLLHERSYALTSPHFATVVALWGESAPVFVLFSSLLLTDWLHVINSACESPLPPGLIVASPPWKWANKQQTVANGCTLLNANDSTAGKMLTKVVINGKRTTRETHVQNYTLT